MSSFTDMVPERAVLLGTGTKGCECGCECSSLRRCGQSICDWIKDLPDVTTVERVPQPELWRWPVVIVILIINTVLGGGFTIALAYANNIYVTSSVAEWCSQIVSTAPMFGLLASLGIPRVRQHFQEVARTFRYPLLPFTVLSSLCWLLSGAILQRFNPLTFCMFVGIATVVQGIMHTQRGYDALSYAEWAVWLFLWMMLDLRWIYSFMWYGVHALSFDWWSLYIATLLLVSFVLHREWTGFTLFTFRLVPHVRDILWGVLGLVPLFALIVPVGIAVGFLRWPPSDLSRITVVGVLSTALEIFFTTAIPEELFFRGILLSGLTELTSGRWAGLLLSSVAFGLMHWVRETQLVSQLAYVGFAVWAGLVYGTVFMLTRRNLLGSVITHTICDTVWAFALS